MVSSRFSLCAERGAIVAGCAEHFKRGHQAGFYAKDGAGMGERRVPAYLEMRAFETVGHGGYIGIHCGRAGETDYALRLKIVPMCGTAGAKGFFAFAA